MANVVFESIVLILFVLVLGIVILLFFSNKIDETSIRKKIFYNNENQEENLELKGINENDAIQALLFAISDTNNSYNPRLKHILTIIKRKSDIDGGNNCLFIACLKYLNIGSDKITPQMLRNVCDLIVVKQGLPISAKGEVAGGEYLQALSLIFSRRIIVNQQSYGKPFLVKHPSVPNNTEVIKIFHMGPMDSGHWVADL